GLADAVITGHFSHPAQVATAARAIDSVRIAQRDGAFSPNPAVVVDPILGDAPRGLYVKAEVAEAVKAELLMRADVLTPNLWELGFLTGVEAMNPAGVGDVRAGRRGRGRHAVGRRGRGPAAHPSDAAGCAARHGRRAGRRPGRRSDRGAQSGRGGGAGGQGGRHHRAAVGRVAGAGTASGGARVPARRGRAGGEGGAPWLRPARSAAFAHRSSSSCARRSRPTSPRTRSW